MKLQVSPVVPCNLRLLEAYSFSSTGGTTVQLCAAAFRVEKVFKGLEGFKGFHGFKGFQGFEGCKGLKGFKGFTGCRV